MDRLRRAAILTVPERVRPAMLALWNLDLAFADVISTTLTPQLGAIRLAWWRERLEELDRGIGPPAEPRLQSIAATLIPSGVTGAELARLEYCWLALLSPFPWGDLVAEALTRRGTILFGIGARLLGREAAEAESLGVIWSLDDAAHHCSDAQSRAFLLDRAKLALEALPRRRIPLDLHPLATIAARCAYDILYPNRGRWHRYLTGLRSALFGIMPR